MTRTTPAHIRVLRRVTIDDDGCWIYAGFLDSDGYGRISVGSRTEGNRSVRGTHRVVYEALAGAIPDGLVLDHLCRVRRCCNPLHLEPVGNRENVLRGDTFSARNVAKTHCPKGHPYSGDNLALSRSRSGVSRKCKTCRAEWLRRYRVERRAAA